MFAPTSEKENRMVREILSTHQNTCSNSFLSEKKTGWGLWLGLNKIGSSWLNSYDNTTLTYHNWINAKSYFLANDADCAFMLGDGSWSSILKDKCKWIQLCVICAISTTPVFTLRGLCTQGSLMHWNYYVSLDGSSQINKYDSYKRGNPISLVKHKSVSYTHLTLPTKA